MCLDSKLLAVAEMFPSWPHKNIPSPLEHHAPVEKCFLLWSYKRHLSITASGKPEREGGKKEQIVWFSREVLGRTWDIIGFYQRQSSSTFFTTDQISCKSIPSFPEERTGTRLLCPVVPSQPQGSPWHRAAVAPLYPPRSRGGSESAASCSVLPAFVCIGRETQNAPRQGGAVGGTAGVRLSGGRGYCGGQGQRPVFV